MHHIFTCFGEDISSGRALFAINEAFKMADNDGQSKKRSRFDQTEPDPRRTSRFDRRSRSPAPRTSESKRSRSPLDQRSPASSVTAGAKSPTDPAAAAG